MIATVQFQEVVVKHLTIKKLTAALKNTTLYYENNFYKKIK